jgi:predicted dehydrogenase
MAIRSGLARQMAETARATGRLLMIGHCLRFWPEYVMIKEMIDSKRYGAVRSALLTRRSGRPGWSDDSWFYDNRRSGSAALDLHVHDVDTIQWMFGVPAKVSSTGSVQADGGIEHITTLYHFANGPSVVAEGAWDYPGPYPFDMAMTVVFERATAVFALSADPSLTVYKSDPREVEHPPVPKANAYTEELRCFVGSIQSGTAPKAVTPEQAAQAVAVVEAEVRSVRTGRPVTVKA